MSVPQPLPWQDAHMRRLEKAIGQGRLAHALLFTGPSGAGKLHLVNSLVYRLLKDESSSEQTVSLLGTETHPDVIRVGLLEDKKQISVDQVRELCERLSLTPQLASIKIAIIEPAEAMNRNAANALLKTLEEPQGNSLLILVSHRHGLLPQTIRSRCQHIPLSLPDPQQASSWVRKHGVEEADEYLEISNGAPLKALQAVEEDRLTQFSALVDDLARLIDSRSSMVSVAAKRKQIEMETLISWLDHIVRSLTRYTVYGEFTSNVTSNLLNNLKISVDRIDLKKLLEYSEYLDKSRLEVDNNLNRELMLEQFFTRWAALNMAV